jgi:hypothetical protein
MLALAVTSGCGESGDPVRGALDRMAEAAEDRDAGKVLEHLAAEFQAADGSGRADAELTLRRYFAAYARLDVEITEVEIERAPNAARARFVAALSGKPRTVGGLEGWLPRSSRYRFDLRLAPEGEGGRWVVTWAAWEDAT